MLSYLIPTDKEPEILVPTFASIGALAPHDYEIVICAPYDRPAWMTDPKVKFIVDDKHAGSTYAMNLGASHCSGEWILVGTDEHVAVFDVNRFLDTIHSEPMQSLEYQVMNLGSPWNATLHHQIATYGPVDTTNIPPDVQGSVYPCITFPAVSRKTIVTKFNGYLFNPNLIHHFVDHWLGFYVSRKSPGYNFNLAGDSYAWRPFRSTWPQTKWDNHDANIFCNLAARLVQNQPVDYTSNI